MAKKNKMREQHAEKQAIRGHGLVVPFFQKIAGKIILTYFLTASFKSYLISR